jgi:hypothetical protein
MREGIAANITWGENVKRKEEEKGEMLKKQEESGKILGNQS